MTEYKCEDCGHTFTEEEVEWRDDGGYEEYWGAKVWMPYNVMICPKCRHNNIEETSKKEEETNERISVQEP